MRSLLPFQLVASDLDGTLLNGQHVVGDFTIDTLRKLEQKQVDIVVATGRKHEDVFSIVAKIGIENIRMITSNGARIHDLSGRLLYKNDLPTDLALEIMNVPFDKNKIFVNSYQDSGWFIDREVPQMAKYHKDSGFGYQVVDFRHHNAQGTEKVFFIARCQQDLLELEQHLRQTYGNCTEIVYASLNCLEIMNKGVSKGNALRKVLHDCHYNNSACIAFGDGMNDETMLDFVGKGCIMQNANPALIHALPQLEIIGHHAHEAVASYLRATFGII